MAQIHLTAKRRFMQFMITKPASVEVDGAPAAQVRWGTTQVIDVAPGAHRLTISFPYLGRQRTGEATAEVQAIEGRPTTVVYRSPFIVTGSGSITLDGQ